MSDLADPVAAADAAGLRHGSDDEPGLRRRRSGRYVDDRGRRVTDSVTIDRIEQLAIPPAWTDVWISPDPRSHLQATGRDRKGRKQYRYHDEWTALRAEWKWDHLADFADALPELRAETGAELRRRSWTSARLVALGVHLLDLTAMRVGNEEYAEENGTHGLTTLLAEHDRSSRRRVRFVYPAKGGSERDVAVSDRRAARLVRECRETDGGTLLTARLASGRLRTLRSEDVNDLLADYDATAKTYRTWAGSAAALRHRLDHPEAPLTTSVDAAAGLLGNTRSVARSSYVHPAVLELDSGDLERLRRTRTGSRRLSGPERRLAELIT